MAYDDILEEAAAPKIFAKGGKPLFKRHPGAPSGNKLSTFGNTGKLISNGTSGVNSVASTIVDRTLNKPTQNMTIGNRPTTNQKQEKEVFERENKRKNLTRSEKARETRIRNEKKAQPARLELTRRRVAARVDQYGTSYTGIARPTAQSKAAAKRRAERLSKTANGNLAPPIVFKNDNFADLLYGKPNYIGHEDRYGPPQKQPEDS